MDKLEMNASKIDESIMVLSKANIKKTILRIEKQSKIKVSDGELEYYMNNVKITKFNTKLVFYYYAKYFSGYRDLNFLTRVQFMKLLIILKRKLQYQGFVYLPQVISSNVENRLCTRTIQNNKFLTKIQTSDIYQSLITDKFSTLQDLNKPNYLLTLLSTILNTSFLIVDYEMQEMSGTKIEMNQDIVCEEFLNFLNQL